jgi:GTP pyrophosphokinase
MHRRAEYGVAAHWKYKEEAKGGNADSEMQWLRQIVDWQKETADPSEFLESLRFDIGSGEIFVFTPKGDVVALPTGSTPVDFAYSVHTEVGHRCIGARINGRLVPLERKLTSGDTVEVFTSKAEGAGPSRDWLTFVASGRARSKIKSWFTKEAREEAVDHGKDLLARAIRKQGLPLQRILSGQALQAVLKDLHLADVNGLYRAVGEGHVQAAEVVKRLVGALGGADGAVEDLAEAALPSRVTARRGRSSTDPGVVVAGDPDVWVKLARCCTPVPPDPIIGFVTRGAGVSVHRADCVNAVSLQEQQDRIVDVEWAPTSESVYLVNIQVEALDRPRLLSDVTRVLSEGHVNILSASVRTDRDRMAISRFSFEMGDPGYLDHLLGQVRQVDGVFDAYRMTSSRPD